MEKNVAAILAAVAIAATATYAANAWNKDRYYECVEKIIKNNPKATDIDYRLCRSKIEYRQLQKSDLASIDGSGVIVRDNITKSIIKLRISNNTARTLQRIVVSVSGTEKYKDNSELVTIDAEIPSFSTVTLSAQLAKDYSEFTTEYTHEFNWNVENAYTF